MPVLPHLYERAAIATDTRILESRQIANAARRAAHSLSLYARDIIQKAPILLRRDKNDPYCSRYHYIQGCYIFGGPKPGALVGIVLGSIAGFLLVLYLLWILSSGTTFIRTSALEVEDDVVVRDSTRVRRSSPNRSRRSHRSSYQQEMRRSSPRRDRVIRRETIVRDVPPPRRERNSSRIRESVIIEESERGERRVENDDIVEVIEEHSSVDGGPPPPRPGKSRRGSRYDR